MSSNPTPARVPERQPASSPASVPSTSPLPTDNAWRFPIRLSGSIPN